MGLHLKYMDTAVYMSGHSHGIHVPKTLLVFHETISSDVPGWKDITSVESFLAAKDYGIHGMADAEGNKAWAYKMGSAIFWHAGGVNTEAIGIELISNIPLRARDNASRYQLWKFRDKQLRAAAKMAAAIHNTRPHQIPLKFSDSRVPGVTSHWNVSKWHTESEGHSDCYPKHLGGYFPILYVIGLARMYAKTGISL